MPIVTSGVAWIVISSVSQYSASWTDDINTPSSYVFNAQILQLVSKSSHDEKVAAIRIKAPTYKNFFFIIDVLLLFSKLSKITK